MIVATLALVAVPSAGAAPANLTSLTQASGIITADWTLPDAATSSLAIELSETDDFLFAERYRVGPAALTFTSSSPRAPGTWYARIVTTETFEQCDPDPPLPGCDTAPSNFLSVNVPLPPSNPPVNVSATQDGGRISVTWTLLPGSAASEIEVGSSTQLDDLNYFIDYVDYDNLAVDQTSYTFVTPQPPGTYYVHVSSVPAACPFCSTDWSTIAEVTIPVPSLPAQPAPPPPPPSPPPPAADKVLALGGVTASSSQKVDKLSITLNPGETVKVKLSGTVSVPGGSKVYRFKTIDKGLGAGKTKLSPKLPNKARKAVKKALQRKKRLKAKLTLVVTDNAGNSTKSNYTVRLKP